MTTKVAQKEAEAETETEAEEKEPTAAEVAAAEKLAAAEKRAEEAEAEAARVKAESTTKKSSHPKGGYSLSSFPENEWAEAEAQTGLDRKQILSNLNMKAQIEHSTMSTIEALESQYAVKDELQDALDADPLSPKFKAEAKKFMSDIPGDLLKTPEGRKKWIAKAITFAKSSVKLPTTGRKAETMDTKETNTVKDNAKDKGFSVEEREVIESHGRTVDDFAKLQHPMIKDGIVIKTKDEKPTFGPR